MLRSSRRILSFSCRLWSIGLSKMGGRRGGGRAWGTCWRSAPRMAMGFEAEEGERLSLKGMGGRAPNGLEKPSSWVIMGGGGSREKSMPP